MDTSKNGHAEVADESIGETENWTRMDAPGQPQTALSFSSQNG